MDKIIELLKDSIDYGYVLAYFDDQVLVGLYESQYLSFSPKRKIDYQKLKKMHVFNKDREVRIVKKQQKYLVKDILGQENPDDYFDEEMYIIDDKKTREFQECFYTYKQYGREVDIPQMAVKNEKLPVKIQVRNVFGVDENTHQIIIDHYRLVDFVQGGE